MVTTIAVQDINSVDGIEVMLLGISYEDRSYTGIKSASKQCGKSGIFELLLVGPLPAVIEVSGKSGFLAALLIDLTPFRVVGIFRLVISSIYIVYLALQAGIHDGKILIRKSDVENDIRMVILDDSHDILYLVGVNRASGDR